MKVLGQLLLLAVCGTLVRGHEVATSSQSMVSGEGWRYGYGIAHGPPGIGHAVGESFPHGYGGFGTYAPSYGYELVPPAPLPPRPVIIKLPHQYVVPSPVEPVPFYPKPVQYIQRPSYLYEPHEAIHPYHLNYGYSYPGSGHYYEPSYPHYHYHH